MFVKKDNPVMPAAKTVSEEGAREKLISALLCALTSPDTEEAESGITTLLREYLTGSESSPDEYFDTALPLSRCAARASAPMVWRALLDEAKDGNMTAIRLYFDIFGRDIGKTGDESVPDPAAQEIGNLRGELFFGEEA